MLVAPARRCRHVGVAARPWTASRTRTPRQLGRYRLLRVALAVIRLGPVLILVGLVVAMTLLSPVFLTTGNIGNVLSQTAAIAVLAIGQLLVILTRGIDLSVGSTLALASVVGAIAFEQRQRRRGRDRRHARHRRGGRLRQRRGVRVGPAAPPVHHHPGHAEHRPGPRPAVLRRPAEARHAGDRPDHRRRVASAGCRTRRSSSPASPCSSPCVLSRLVWGRWIYATGGNPEAARRTGIPVRSVLISVYVLCGLLAGVAAIITSGRLNAGSPTSGALAELDSIAAVIIGGASFLGGRGNVANALVGALMIGVIRNGMNLLNVDAFLQPIVIGVVIVLAVESDVLRGRLEERFRVLQAALT